MTRKLPAAMTPWKLALRWSNPMTRPPEGWPEVLAEARIDQPAGKGAPRRKEWPEEFHQALSDERARPGSGYGLFIAPDTEAIHAQRKAWSPERKAATRVRELRKRLEKEAGPLFPQIVEEAVVAEVEARPDYFDPERIPAFEERERARAEEFFADLKRKREGA